MLAWFHLIILRKMKKSFWTISKTNTKIIFVKMIFTPWTMDEARRIYLNLSDITQFRLNKINDIKDYFIAEFEKQNQLLKD